MATAYNKTQRTDELCKSLRNIFITGASGCIGHYVIEALLSEPDLHLYLLIRNRGKLLLHWTDIQGGRVTLVDGDMLTIEKHEPLLKQMDMVIHLAAAWGGDDVARAVNVTKTLELFNLLDRDRCQKILYFSTASLLDRDNRPVEVASEAGTAYIRTKFEMLMRRGQIKLRDRTITIFPTLVFGGDEFHPYSHISSGLTDITRWIFLIRFFKAEGSFHFLHAFDIAQVTRHLLMSLVQTGDWVLGNPELHVNDCIEQISHYYDKPVYFRIPLPVRFARKVAPYFGARLSPWDDYCIEHRYFTHKVVNPSTFQVPTQFPDVNSILKKYG
ncbi:MAG: NAD(P)-dependent oxidoreductase [Cyanobacteria bacterium P01_A01_bin.3]